MPRTRDRLTALKVTKLSKPGLYADGGGLYLQVTSRAAKSWIFRYKAQSGGERYMGIGAVADVPLATARQKAAEARTLRMEGTDPLDHRDHKRAQADLSVAQAMTFAQAAEAYIAGHESGWRNPKHRQQWRNTIRDYANPIVGHLPVASVDTGLVCKVLEPIWREKPETAGRVRGRIETVLDWAKVRGYRDGDNPARWRGHLDKLLPKRPKGQNHPALPYGQMPRFWTDLAPMDSLSAEALKFTILTAARTNETIGARWQEFDLSEAIWTVPAGRMKGDREHVVPLTDAVVALLQKRKAAGGSGPFPLSNMAMLNLLDGMGYEDGKGRAITVHGFRSTFRDWAGDETHHARDVVEAALAHLIENETEAAYRRSTALAKRRALMIDWERFASTPRDGRVVPLKVAR